MRKPTGLHGRLSRARADACMLVTVLLLFGGIVAGIAACGSDDLVFPGNIPATPTSRFTATPGTAPTLTRTPVL